MLATKTVTKNKTEGLAVGKGKKDHASLEVREAGIFCPVAFSGGAVHFFRCSEWLKTPKAFKVLEGRFPYLAGFVFFGLGDKFVFIKTPVAFAGTPD